MSSLYCCYLFTCVEYSCISYNNLATPSSYFLHVRHFLPSSEYRSTLHATVLHLHMVVNPVPTMEASRSEVDESFLCSESVPAVGLVKENEASLDLQYHPVRQQIPSVPQTRSSIYNTVSPRTSLPVEFPLLASSSSDSSHSVTTSDLSKTADDVLGPLQPDHSTKAFLHMYEVSFMLAQGHANTSIVKLIAEMR